MTRVAIAVFAKAPVPGFAKTRLIPALGAEGAAALQAAMTRRALATAREAGFLDLTLWCAPGAAHPFFVRCAREFDVALRAQADGDLGARMAAAFASRAPALLIGSDCPSITKAHLRDCAAALARRDAVFLPAEDGGYGLVGLRAPAARLFEGIAWSTPAVMTQTRERLAALGLSHVEPATIWDVDEPADLGRLATLDPPFFFHPGERSAS